MNKRNATICTLVVLFIAFLAWGTNKVQTAWLFAPGAYLLAPAPAPAPAPTTVVVDADCPPSLYDVLWGVKEGYWTWAYHPADCDQLPAIPDSEDWFLTMGPITRHFEGEDIFSYDEDGTAVFANIFSTFWMYVPEEFVKLEPEVAKAYHVVCDEAEVSLRVRYHTDGDTRSRDLQGKAVCKNGVTITEVEK